MAKKKQTQKKSEKDEYYPENGFEYNDTGYNNLYLLNIDKTFDSDFIYTVIIE